MVNDSTDINFGTQNTEAKLMGTAPYAMKLREKAVKVTKAMKEEKVYQKYNARGFKITEVHADKEFKKAENRCSV